MNHLCTQQIIFCCIQRETEVNLRTQCTEEVEVIGEIIFPFSFFFHLPIFSSEFNSFSLLIQDMPLWNLVVKIINFLKLFFLQYLYFPVCILYACRRLLKDSVVVYDHGPSH